MLQLIVDIVQGKSGGNATIAFSNMTIKKKGGVSYEGSRQNTIFKKNKWIVPGRTGR